MWPNMITNSERAHHGGSRHPSAEHPPSDWFFWNLQDWILKNIFKETLTSWNLESWHFKVEVQGWNIILKNQGCTSSLKFQEISFRLYFNFNFQYLNFNIQGWNSRLEIIFQIQGWNSKLNFQYLYFNVKYESLKF